MMERKLVNGQYVTWEKCDDDILRQAKAIKTARREGMVTPSKGKAVARRAAPGLRSVQSIFTGMIAKRKSEEVLGINA